ncbi:MAG: hypothetical protein IJJ26_06175 [Victivallales bacterium]|nr:hypothetical protein [Victivallales bacterium]
MTFPLVMTAAVDPKGMPGLSVNDVSERANQYLGTLRFYLENPAVPQIVFVENSGYDLAAFRELATQYPDKQIEFLSCDRNDYPRHLGKSYGEMWILDYVVDTSQSVQAASGFTKVTGRFPILNIAELLQEAEQRRPWELFCDNKDHPVYDWLQLGWNGHACDTRFFLVTTDFYRKHFYGRYTELDDSQGKLVESLFFQVARDTARTEKVVRRFRTEPQYSGKAGHVQISIIGVNDYDSRTAKTKRAIRRIARKLLPWFWF